MNNIGCASRACYTCKFTKCDKAQPYCNESNERLPNPRQLPQGDITSQTTLFDEINKTTWSQPLMKNTFYCDSNVSANSSQPPLTGNAPYDKISFDITPTQLLLVQNGLYKNIETKSIQPPNIENSPQLSERDVGIFEYLICNPKGDILGSSLNNNFPVMVRIAGITTSSSNIIRREFYSALKTFQGSSVGAQKTFKINTPRNAGLTPFDFSMEITLQGINILRPDYYNQRCCYRKWVQNLNAQRLTVYQAMIQPFKRVTQANTMSNSREEYWRRKSKVPEEGEVASESFEDFLND